jgi:hypothetical protein
MPITKEVQECQDEIAVDRTVEDEVSDTDTAGVLMTAGLPREVCATWKREMRRTF